MSYDLNEWNLAWCKGLISSYVARGQDRPERIAKSLATTMAKGELDRNSLQGMLTVIERESVQPFLGPQWNQPERLERFQAVRSAIHLTLGDG